MLSGKNGIAEENGALDKSQLGLHVQVFFSL